MKRFALFLLGLLLAQSSARAQVISDQALRQITFAQNLGASIPLDAVFHDETGRTVVLQDYFGAKPVILVLGYYGCPMLCTFVLNGLVGSLQDINWQIGQQFDVINISIDPSEGPALAAAKKRTYLKRYGRMEAAQGWHFLTGDAKEIHRVADAAGFHYTYDPVSKQYAHPSGLVVLSRRGKISHYLSGVIYSPAELKHALVDAAAEKTGSPVRDFFLLCFHYSPITGKYGQAVMLSVRICGAAVFLALLGGVIVMLRQERKPAKAAP